MSRVESHAPSKSFDKTIASLELGTATDIHLRSRVVTPDDILQFRSHLSSNSQLTQIILQFCSLKDVSLEMLSGGLPLVQNLTVLDLGFNHITDAGIRKLTPGLCKLQNLQTLDLQSNQISYDGISLLCKTFPFLPQLRLLLLADNFIKDQAMGLLCKSFQHLPRLEQLSLGYNSITDESVSDLCQCLRFIPKLKELSLTHNHITEEGFFTIATYLRGKHAFYFSTLSLVHSRANVESELEETVVDSFVIPKQVQVMAVFLSVSCVPRLASRKECSCSLLPVDLTRYLKSFLFNDVGEFAASFGG
jgi:hypothetical protein